VDVKETKMKTQDIKNMGLALQQVQEKILTQKDKEKALAKAARTAKPKDQVTLPKAPFDIPKKGANEAYESYHSNVIKAAKMYMKDSSCSYKQAAEAYGCSAEQVRKCAKEMMHKEGKMECPKCEGKGCDHCDNKGYHMNEELKGGQHKLDHDKDGDIDAADFKGLRKKKKGEKSEVKPRQEPDTEKGKGDAPMEKTESTRWPVYARIMEKKSHTAGATAPEEMDSKDSPTAKKMKADHKPEVKDNPEASGDDVKKATDSAPAMKARSNDNMKGDKAIVNPVKGAVTK
jgi:hypothetical protein